MFRATEKDAEKKCRERYVPTDKQDGQKVNWKFFSS
jgi:hypothetical protein